MVEITIELDTSPVGKLTEKWQKARPLGLKYAADNMTLFLMVNSPVDHGLLRQWFIDSIDDEEAHIKSPAEYAIYQDQGTRDHWIEPVNTKALHWTGRGFGRGGAFSKGHMVSGIQGKHFVEQSFNQLQPRVKTLFLRALEEVD